MPLIEVLIATYNRADLIIETVESILSQGPDVFIRIEDDGSTDGTSEALQPYLLTGRVAYSHRPASGGPATPRNRALMKATAPFVTFFDADDLMNTGHLAHHVELLRAHPEWVAVVCDYRNFSRTGEFPQTLFQTCPQLSKLLRLNAGTRESSLVLDEQHAKRLITKENFSSACGVVYRREVAQRLGGFDESLPASEDFDIFWRLLSEGPIGISSFCGFRRRVHAGNMSHEQVKILHCKVRSRLKLLRLEKDPVVRGDLRLSIAEFLDALAYNQFPSSFTAGAVSAFRALYWGAPFGRFPTQAMRAAARVCLKR